MRCHRWLGIAMCLLLASSQAVAAAPAKPIVTNKLRFRIPFRFDAAALQRMNARELHLYASTNRGASWGVAQSMSPQAGRFEYQAAGDGEYWFAVRTIDGFGQAHPGGEQLEPGLIVVVDTAPPQLDLQLQPIGSGRVQLNWQAQDTHLDSGTLRLEYLQPGSPDWQSVSVSPRGSGQTSWSVPQGGQVAVRGSIADLAGNQGFKQAQAMVGGGEVAPKPAGPALREPIAATSPSPFAPQDSQPGFAGPVITPGQINGDPAAAGRSPIAPQPQFISGQPIGRPEITQERWQTAEMANGDAAAPYRPSSRQRIVNTLRFQLGYKIDDLGPSGVGSVDLYITQDHGRKWWRYGEDADRTSPIDVEVPQDGEYGFAVRVRSGAGLGADPPASGEPPSIYVVVDQSPPTLELMPLQQGQGAAMNQIQIRWRLADAYPTDKSISLYYAPTAQGPWELISGWRQDTGSFAWTVGAGAPSQFYVRVMGRDAAGNIAKAETPQPIVVDLSRPSARIVDVEVQPVPSPQ
jgi:hypothetical protein